MNPQSVILDGYFDQDTLSVDIDLSSRTIDRLIDQPDGLPVVRLGRRKLFNIESVRKWLAQREAQRNPGAQRVCDDVCAMHVRQRVQQLCNHRGKARLSDRRLWVVSRKS